MRYVAVMPYVIEEYAERAAASCRFDDLLLVNNSVHNLGIMRSHNLGLDLMRERDADWLIVMSAAVRFGDPGGLDYLERIGEHAHEWVVIPAQGVFGWHLIAFSRAALDAAGRWDEQFFPYGYDDVDLSIRIHKALPGCESGGVPCDVDDSVVGMGHSIRRGGVRPNRNGLAYLTEKWGAPHGQPFDAYYDYPWNDATNPIGFWPPVDGARWDGPSPTTEQTRLR